MSVPFFKILSGVFLAHLLVLSLVWVGFSTPFPRPPATFVYEGALPVDDSVNGGEDEWPRVKASDQFTLDHSESSHWLKLRAPSKPLFKVRGDRR